MKFQIDRSKWLNGELFHRHRNVGKKPPASMLCNNRGEMCCLGFFSEAMGVPRKVLLGLGEPGDLEPDYARLLPSAIAEIKDTSEYDDEDGLTDHSEQAINGYVADELIGVNDAGDLEPEEREAGIIANFAKIEVEVEFVGEYPVVK